jgi:hypothetical protein
VFLARDVAEDAYLTGETKPGVALVRRDPQSQSFASGPAGDGARNLDRAGPTGPQTAAVQYVRRTVVRRFATGPKDVTEHRTLFTVELAAAEPDSGHVSSDAWTTQIGVGLTTPHK